VKNIFADEEARVQEYWDRNAKNWVPSVRRGYDRQRRNFHDPLFYQVLGDVSNLRIVELGCGEGITCRALAERGAQFVVGVDISSAMIEAARSALAPDPALIQYVVSSISDVPSLEAGSFDCVVSVMTLMDLPNINAAMGTAKRLLKHGGFFVFSITHPIWDRINTEWELSPPGTWQLKLGNYFDSIRAMDRWNFSLPDGTPAHAEPFEIPYYSRTVAEYLNTAIDVGLRLERLVEEPAPTQDDGELERIFERWRKIPFYLMARFRS
jgi:SAM-dependent methyltransferase